MKKRWLSFLLSLSMIAGSLTPSASVFAEDMFVSDTQEMTQDVEYAADEGDFFEPSDSADEFSDGMAEGFFDEEEDPEAPLFFDSVEDEAITDSFDASAAEGTELPSYIFGGTWNAQYDVLYYEAGKAYVYDGKEVTFQDENTVLVGETSYAVKNKAVVITIDTTEEGTVVKLDSLNRPVGQISGQWNSTYAGSTKAVYQSAISGMERVESGDIKGGDIAELNLGKLEAGEYKLTGGAIHEAANQWSPGTNFGDGKGTVKERDFGYLPDIAITIKATVPEEEDAYLGVDAGSEVPASFTNDLWTQYDYLEMEISGTAKLNPRRVEEAITDAVGNDVEYPNFNYTIIKGDSVTIDASVNRHAVVKAVKEGVTVVQVTYDAFDHSRGKHFDAVDPVNTAYVVYSVGGNKDITITDNIVQKDEDKQSTDDVVFRSYDTLYYTDGDTAPFTLKASAQGAEKLTVKCNGMTVQESSTGTWVLPLENRSNIIELKATAADGTTRSKYHVLDARKIKINVENKTAPGMPLAQGQTATVSFTGVTIPVYKLATIYNPVWTSTSYGTQASNVHYECDGILYRGECGQWDLATKNSFDVELTKAGTYDFTNGKIWCEWWGDPLGSDKENDDPGAPNLNAQVKKGEFSFMPQFSFTVEGKIPVESITLDKTEATLEYEETLQLNAVVMPENASFSTLTWESDNTGVATVSPSGLVTAVSEGTATITATGDGMTATCVIKVNRPVLSQVAFAEKEISLYKTQIQQLTVEYTPSYLLEEDKAVTYTSSDDSIVSVDEAGVITAKSVGNAVITVTSKINPELQGTCQVEVKDIDLDEITLNKETAEMKPGCTESLTVSVAPEFLMDTAVFQWSSSDETIATVDENGKVTALKAGSCTITVRMEGFDKTASCEITVEETEDLGITTVVTPEKVYDGDTVDVTFNNVTRPEKVGEQTVWEHRIHYKSDIPGCENLYGYGSNHITFRVPDGTPSGTYYLTDGYYYVNYGGSRVQGMFLIGNTEENFYEGQMPLIAVQVTNLQVVRDKAVKELEEAVDLDKYAPEQQERIKEIMDQAKESVGILRDEEQISQTIEKAESLIRSIKTSSQITEEKLAEGKNAAKESLDTYVNLEDYREQEQKDIELIIALAKLDIIAASSQEKIDEIVQTAKNKINGVKTDAQLTEEEKGQITPTPTPTDTPTVSQKQTLILKVSAGKTNAALTWNKLKGVDGYKIYGSKCGDSYKLLKTVPGSTFSWKQSRLKKATYYKYYVVAYKMESVKEKIVAKSDKMHIITAGGKYGNPVKVKVNKSSVSIKAGRTSQLKATVTNSTSKVRQHTEVVRYLSTNPSVATVSKNGKIKGVGKGKCNVYCYAQNGLYRKVKVTVK